MIKAVDVRPAREILCALVVLGSTRVAGASDHDEQAALRVGPRQTPRLERHTAATADYNAPDPDRDALSHARALANLIFSSWFVWQINWFRGEDWVPVTGDSLASNLRRGFELDRDELQTNFFGHPYHGGMMFTSARAAGLGFWESVPYTLLGSLSWELFAEREQASSNDLAMTTLGGIILGEITYRLSSELLDDRSSGQVRVARELGAAGISPMRGFNRLLTGRAWSHGREPERHRVEAAFNAGVDRVRVIEERSDQQLRPAALFAADVTYGDLLPRKGPSFEPFEFFDLYAAASLFNSVLQGVQIYTTGLLYGLSAPVSDDRFARRDNNVAGLSMTYEFQGSNIATYGGAGIGPADYIVLRLGHRRSLRVGFGIDMVPILGVTPNDPVRGERAYNFGTGASAWARGTLDLARAGRFRARSRHYATHVLDGVEGGDYLGATRLSYELDVIEGLGVGVAPMFIQRRSLTADDDDSSYQFDTQVYVRVHN